MTNGALASNVTAHSVCLLNGIAVMCGALRGLCFRRRTREIVQNTFIRIWKHLPEFDGHSRFTTWIYTITFNICLDRIKNTRRRSECQFSEKDIEHYQATSACDDPDSTADVAILAGAIQKYAKGLGATQQLIFVLRDLQDLPVEEVCRITGFDAVKVKTNLYYARKFIREKLTKGGYL
jgi:RNA polymerase sigma-70 factor (ECF subfamily)